MNNDKTTIRHYKFFLILNLISFISIVFIQVYSQLNTSNLSSASSKFAYGILILFFLIINLPTTIITFLLSIKRRKESFLFKFIFWSNIIIMSYYFIVILIIINNSI